MSIALVYETKASMQKHLSVCCLCKCLGNFQKIQETKVSGHSIEIIVIIEYLWWGYICGSDKTMCGTGFCPVTFTSILEQNSGCQYCVASTFT